MWFLTQTNRFYANRVVVNPLQCNKSISGHILQRILDVKV